MSALTTSNGRVLFFGKSYSALTGYDKDQSDRLIKAERAKHLTISECMPGERLLQKAKSILTMQKAS